jgi:hypothetical protein
MGGPIGIAVGGGLRNKQKTHCRNGHEYTPENTVLVRGGKARACRICRKATNEKAHAKRNLNNILQQEKEL